MTILAALLIPAVLTAALIALLKIAGRVHERRAEAVARQIELTDAVHRELGAFAAPLVRRRRHRWEVVLPVPFGHPAVAQLVGLAHATLPEAAIVLVARPEPHRLARPRMTRGALAPALPGRHAAR